MDNTTRGIWLDVMNELRQMRDRLLWEDSIDGAIGRITAFVDTWECQVHNQDESDQRLSAVRLIALCVRFLQDTPAFQPDPAARYEAEATKTDDALFGVHDAIVMED